MKSADKEEVMLQFKAGEIQILVSTTVIEVGVDVPNATIMVVENAERFGLPQMHQLRGRVGRGEKESYCFLIATYPISREAKTRLSTLAETNDGFKIAEEDLRLRGSGETLGTKQSGLPDFKLADFAEHQSLFYTAHQDASLIIEKDPDLKSERGEALRTLLYLFEKDEMIKTLRSG